MGQPPPNFLFVCTGPTCGERGGRALLTAWKAILVERGAWERLRVAPVHCFGQCSTGPNACTWPDGRIHSGLDPSAPETALDAIAGAAARPAASTRER